MFKCNQCAFQGDYKQNLKRHERNMHGNNKNEMYNNNSAPNIASIANNAHPRSGNIITKELDPSQVYNPTAKTVSIEEYNKANECVHGWKSAYDNLKNQTGSGNIYS